MLSFSSTSTQDVVSFKNIFILIFYFILGDYLVSLSLELHFCESKYTLARISSARGREATPKPGTANTWSPLFLGPLPSLRCYLPRPRLDRLEHEPSQGAPWRRARCAPTQTSNVRAWKRSDGPGKPNFGHFNVASPRPVATKGHPAAGETAAPKSRFLLTAKGGQSVGTRKSPSTLAVGAKRPEEHIHGRLRYATLSMYINVRAAAKFQQLTATAAMQRRRMDAWKTD